MRATSALTGVTTKKYTAAAISRNEMAALMKSPTGNTAPWTVKLTAEKSGFDDGVMFDREGHLTEASAANVFLIAEERLVTPRLKPDVFPGTTRQVLLEIARGKGIEVCEAELRREDMKNIDGAFLCSTLMEIRAVSRLGERALPSAELPLYRSLVSAFRSVTHQ